MSKLGVDKILTSSGITKSVTQNSATHNNKKKKKNKMTTVTGKSDDVPKNWKLKKFQEYLTAVDKLPDNNVHSRSGFPKDPLYIDTCASLHIFFNEKLIYGLSDLQRPLKTEAGSSSINLSQVGTLHQALQ